MTIKYSQLAQVRENSTNAVSIYSPNVDETVQVFLKISNSTASTVKARVFHDNDGVVYDESTQIVWDIDILAGSFLELDKIFMDNENGNLAYSSSVANALTATVYGIVKI